MCEYVFLIRSVIGGGGERGYAVAQLVEASILSGRIMAQGSTQPLAEMSTRDFPWEVKAAGGWGWQPYYLKVQTVWKSWEPQPPGALRACPGR